MQISEFVEATTRIEAYYGKEYTTEQRKIMYEELQGFTIERYKQLISVVLKKCEFRPKIVDFINADLEFPTVKEEVEKEKYECAKCKGIGYVIYKKTYNDGGKRLVYTYAARCDCENGKNLPSVVPMLSQFNF